METPAPESLAQRLTRLQSVRDPLKRIDALNAEAWELRYVNAALAQEIAQHTRLESTQLHYKPGEARAWHILGVAHALQSNHQQAQEDLQLAYDGYAALLDRHSQTEATANIATVYQLMGQYDIALEWQFRALRLSEELAIMGVVGNTLTNIGIIYAEIEQYDEALEYHRRGLEIKEKRDDAFGIAASLNAIGEAYHKLGRLFTALDYQERSLERARTLGVPHAMGFPLLGIGQIRMDMGEYAKAEDAFKQALEIFRQMHNPQGEAQVMNALCHLYRHTKAFEKATEHGLRALDIAWEVGAHSLQADCHKAVAEAYREAGKMEMAYHHLEHYIKLRSEVFRKNAAQTFKTLQKYHTYEKAEQDRELLRLKNVEMQRKQEAILTQKDELEEALTQTELSIKAASRIQRAMLPQADTFEAHFQDHFVMYIPRDGVSGDFFWLEAQAGRVLLAAADCTGHGVPGALMSMLGYSLLKQIVNERGYHKPNKVLTLLDHHTREVLCRTNHPQQVNDGMDIGLLAFDPITREVEFAGAYNPLYHVRNGELTEIKANRHAIGGKLDGRLKIFDLQTIQTQPGDCLYLLSDGLADQFGRQGDRNRKFGPQRLRNLLAEMHPLPLPQQRARLVQEFMTWKGSLPQLDDVLVVGVRV